MLKTSCNPRSRTLLAVFVIVLGLLPTLSRPLLHSADAIEGEVKQIAMMPSGSGSSILRLLVDPDRNIGYAIGDLTENGSSVGDRTFIYDLARLKLVGTGPAPFAGLSTARASLDSKGGRIFFPPGSFPLGLSGCPLGIPEEDSSVAVLKTSTMEWSRLSVECSRGDNFRMEGLSFHPGTGKLYALGSLLAERSARPFVAQDSMGQTILLRQMSIDGDRLTTDWEIDLRTLGCDRIVPSNDFGAFVARYRDSVLAYCYGARNSASGSQGYVVNARLQADQTPVLQISPALPNDLFPILDPASGRLLLLTAGKTNGTAVWVYEIERDRFAGVVASGIANGESPTTYFGLNEDNGRTYLLSSAGLLVADTRHTPLPAGLNFPVLTDLGIQGAGAYIAVAPKLGRLFVPVSNKGFAVLEDSVEEPDPIPPVDPDRGTADIPEVADKTGRVFGGAGAAFGIRVLNTGGLTRAANNIDPTCFFDQVLRSNGAGLCLTEQFVTSGNRDLFLAATQSELGSETGVSARAAGSAFASEDTATDADFKRVGSCLEDSIENQAQLILPEEFSSFCNSTGLPIFSYGTRGKGEGNEAGKGFPIPSSSCEHFSAEKVDAREDMQRANAYGLPTQIISSSSVKCDNTGPLASAKAAVRGFELDPNADFRVASATSTVTTSLTPQGAVTTLSASTKGVTIGPVAIGQVTTSIQTRALGRTGTSEATFERRISGFSSPTYSCETECDSAKVIAAINSVLGLKARAYLPEEYKLKSPKGYQGVVIKDPLLRDSDQAVNDDSTFAIPGIQIVFFNDGTQGRNRLVLQLAGVQAESRYGVYLLPVEGETESGDDLFSLEDGLEELGPFGELPSEGSETFVERVKRAAVQALRYPLVAAEEALKLIVTNPREFGVLFAMWVLLASPIYLAIRRRTSPLV